MIVKRGNKFRVVSKKGKNLGESESKEGAEKRLRQVEWFKHHSKCLVDPELVKGRQFLPIIFQTSKKKSDQEGEKLDFPSTGKQMEPWDVKQPEFPSAPYKGEPLASTFGNLRPSDPVKDGAITAIQPSSGKYEAGSFRGEHGPDTQYKGSDYVSEDVKKKVRAKKSVMIAGRKIALVKGDVIDFAAAKKRREEKDDGGIKKIPLSEVDWSKVKPAPSKTTQEGSVHQIGGTSTMVTPHGGTSKEKPTKVYKYDKDKQEVKKYEEKEGEPFFLKKKIPATASHEEDLKNASMIKGEGGDNAYLRDSYPIDKGDAGREFGLSSDADRRKEQLRQERMKEKMTEYERAKKQTSLQPPRDPKSITHDPSTAYLGRAKTIRFKKGNKSIANLVLQYTQAQPLHAAFKPLIAYLVKDDEKKEKKEDSLKVTTFTEKHVGKSKERILDREEYSPGEMRSWVSPKKVREMENANPHLPKTRFKNYGKEGDEANKELDAKKSNRYEKHMEDKGLIPYGGRRAKTAKEEADIKHILRDKNRTYDDETLTAAERSGRKSVMPETTVAPPKRKTISPAGTIAQMIKEKMAANDKKEKEENRTDKSVIGPFRPAEGKPSGQSEYSEYLKEQGKKAKQRQEEAKLKANTAKVKKATDPNPIKGGIGDELQYDDVDQKELEVGTKIEQEHVGRNKQMSDEEKAAAGADIALDHLKEDEKYYTNLVEMERKAKEAKKEETKKKKLLAEALKSNDAEKSVIKERKLQGIVGAAERMVEARESTSATPREVKIARGQLRTYSKKLAAERKKNQNLLRASRGLEKGGFKEKWIKEQESKGKDPLKTPAEQKKVTQQEKDRRKEVQLERMKLGED